MYLRRGDGAVEEDAILLVLSIIFLVYFMGYKSLEDSLAMSEERLFGVIREGVAEYLGGFKERLQRYDREVREVKEENEALAAENAALREAGRDGDDEVLRRVGALPIDFVEQYAKECASWEEAKPIYDLLVEFADGNRDIKQKARNIKSHHTRKMNKAMVTNYNYAAGAAHHDSRRIVNIYDEEQELPEPKLISNI